MQNQPHSNAIGTCTKRVGSETYPSRYESIANLVEIVQVHERNNTSVQKTNRKRRSRTRIKDHQARRAAKASPLSAPRIRQGRTSEEGHRRAYRSPWRRRSSPWRWRPRTHHHKARPILHSRHRTPSSPVQSDRTTAEPGPTPSEAHPSPDSRLPPQAEASVWEGEADTARMAGKGARGTGTKTRTCMKDEATRIRARRKMEAIQKWKLAKMATIRQTIN